MGFELIPPLEPSAYTDLMGIDPGAYVQQQAALRQQQAQQMAQQAQAKVQQDKINAATAAAIANPSAQNYSTLFLLNPAARESIKAAHDALETDQQNAKLRDLSALRGYAASGDVQGFQSAMQRRIAADKAAGLDTSDDEHWASQAATPEGLKQIAPFLDYNLAAIMGPDKWQEAFGPSERAAAQAETSTHNRAEEANQAAAQAETARHNLAEENKPIAVGKDQVLVDPNSVGPAQPGAQPQPAGAPVPTGGTYDQIGQVAAQAGASDTEQAYLRRLAQIESGGKTTARNGSSTGVFQFHPSTFAAAGGGDINDVGDQTKAALNLARTDAQGLARVGLPATAANLYVMHQQGPGGGLALLTADPGASAVDALTPIYRNRDTAIAAIAGNIGMPYKTAAQREAANAKAEQMTAGDFVNMWRQRWNGPQAQTAAPQQAAQGGQARIVFDNRQPDAPDDVPLSAPAIELAAGKYLRDGTLPTFGGGKIGAQNKVAIYNRAAEIAKGLGLDANDVIAGTANTKALGQALGRATAMRSAVEGSESTVLKNMDYAMSLAPKAVGGTVPVFNRWEQYIRGQYAGDPAVASFDTALHTVADEYAKVMTTSTGTGGAPTSDSARQEAYRRLSPAQTLDQLNATMGVMRNEMANRTASLRDVETGLRTQLRSGPGSAATPAPSAPAPPAAPPGAPAGTSGIGPNGHTPIFSPDQFRAAARNPANKGKQFYDLSGNLRHIP